MKDFRSFENFDLSFDHDRPNSSTTDKLNKRETNSITDQNHSFLGSRGQVSSSWPMPKVHLLRKSDHSAFLVSNRSVDVQLDVTPQKKGLCFDELQIIKAAPKSCCLRITSESTPFEEFHGLTISKTETIAAKERQMSEFFAAVLDEGWEKGGRTPAGCFRAKSDH